MESTSPSVHYALQVALQTMKERCVTLQKRVTTVEYENQSLRERLAEKNSSQDSKNSESLMENNQLRLQIVELNRQKNQLSEHLTMVSNENRKLWSRLSQISKDQDKCDSTYNDDATLVNDVDVGVEESPRNGSHQNLIRSKTFTQHSPNPNLRHKLISHKITSCNNNPESDLSKMSLEEVTLDRKNSCKSQTYDEENEAANSTDGIGFGYLNDYNEEETGETGVDEMEITTDLKKLVDNMQGLKRLAQEQYEVMNVTKQIMKNNNKAKVCNECIKKSQKPEMADKSLETDDSLHDPILKQKIMEVSDGTNTILGGTMRANEVDQICPICGKKYDNNVSFSQFQEHVEYHFLDESNDVDQSIERNFEYISHTVGDF